MPGEPKNQFSLVRAAAKKQIPISKRLTRALGRLRERFVARGVPVSGLVSGTCLGLAIESHAVQSAPATLAGILTKAALATSIATAPGIGAVSTKLISSLAMTKSQALLLSSTAVAIAIPWGLEQSKITALRTAGLYLAADSSILTC